MNVVPGNGQVPVSPPPNFPLYGLEASWQGARWLEMFGDAIGDPVRWVTLGHQAANTDEALLFITSYSRPLTDAQAVDAGQAPLLAVAEAATFVLANLTRPEQPQPTAADSDHALIDLAGESAGLYAQWPTVGWHVSDVSVTARIWHVADGWAAVSDAVQDAYLAAVGVGGVLEELTLDQIRNGRAYHFDLGQPLHYARVMSSARLGGVAGER